MPEILKIFEKFLTLGGVWKATDVWMQRGKSCQFICKVHNAYFLDAYLVRGTIKDGIDENWCYEFNCSRIPWDCNQFRRPNRSH